MGMLPVEIVTRAPHPRAVQFVREFAKKTGDLGFLSPPDIDVRSCCKLVAVDTVVLQVYLWTDSLSVSVSANWGG